MKCPRCGKRLLKVGQCGGEWICANDKCNPTGLDEYYGLTQAEVNKNSFYTEGKKKIKRSDE